MDDRIDMSLDDIIKMNKSSKSGIKRGRVQKRSAVRGGRGGRRSFSGGRNVRNGPNRGRGQRSRSAGFSRSAPDGRWTHDLFDRRGSISPGKMSGPGKLLVSNLDYGVSNSDVEELFSEFGVLKSATVHYDRSSRSLGTADVIFERRNDALKAMKQYNGVPLDGRPMKIELASSSQDLVSRRIPVRPIRDDGRRRRSGMGNRQGSSPRRGGRGGGRMNRRSSKGPPPSAEDLDKELDAYLKAR